MLVQALEPRTLLAAELVADLNPVTASSDPGATPPGYYAPAPFIDVNGVTYFTATHQDYGTELWRSDGTEAGTVLVKDLNPGLNSSEISNLTNFNGTLVFVARSTPGTGGSNEYQLYKTDGTADGTVSIGRIQTYYQSNSFRLTPVGDTLYFVANSFNRQPGQSVPPGDDLWKTDGTTAGTSIVYDSPSYFGLDPQNLTNVNGTLYFGAIQGGQTAQNTGVELWKSDGTAAGTVLVKDIHAGGANSSPRSFTAVGDSVFFTAIDATGETLWKTDGTPDGTVKVKSTGQPANPAYLTAAGGTLYFASGGALWSSDGTEAGTVALPSPFTAGPRHLTAVGSTVFFNGTDAAAGSELWKVDAGTGPMLVRDLSTTSSDPVSLTNVNGTLYFAALNGLYKSDGTTAGTTLVYSFAGAAGARPPANLTASGGRLMFVGSDLAAGVELWRTNGLRSNTVRVKDIRTDTLPSTPSDFVAGPNGTFAFVATHPTAGQELFVSDGTAAGTKLVKDINPGGASSSIEYLVRGHDAWYFKAFDPTNGHELWKSDGTAAGTVMVSNHRAGADGGFPYNITPLGDKLVFDAVIPAGGTRATYVSSGVVGEPFVQIAPGNSPYVAEFARAGNLVYFCAGGNDLWVTDGTAANTFAVASNVLTSALSFDPRLTPVGEMMYFVSGAGDLWKSDGTVAGTVMVKDLTGTGVFEMEAVGDVLLFQSGNEIWRSDGTPIGTAMLASYAARPNSLTAVVGPGDDGVYYTVGFQGSPRPVLYRYDAFFDTISVVKDFTADGANIGGQLVAFGGRLYFTVNHPTYGNEWWTTNGSAFALTGFVQDIRPGATGAAINGATAIGNTLYFSADDGAHGAELWKITPYATLDANGTLTIDNSDVGGELRVGAVGRSGLNVYRHNGEAYSFEPADVKSIVFHGSDGDDYFALGLVQATLEFHGGGGGNDRLQVSGSSGNITLLNDASAESDTLRLTALLGRMNLAVSQEVVLLDITNGVVSLEPGGDKTLDVHSISITGSGRLDLHDNDLIARSETYASVHALIAKGRGADGSWPGSGGITSSAAAGAAGLTTLAAAPAAAVIDFGPSATAVWNGRTVAGDDVLIKYTYAGDANLDGAITGDDYSAIDLAILFAGSNGYFNGDFNYDGYVTGDDYSVIDLNILLQGEPL